MADLRKVESYRIGKNVKDMVSMVLSEEELPEMEDEEYPVGAEWMDAPTKVGEVALNLLCIWFKDAEVEKKENENPTPFYKAVGLAKVEVLDNQMEMRLIKHMRDGGTFGESALYFFYFVSKVPSFSDYLIEKHESESLDCLVHCFSDHGKRMVKLIAIATLCNMVADSPKDAKWVKDEFQIAKVLGDTFHDLSDGEEEDIMYECVIRGYKDEASDVLANVINEDANNMQMIIFDLLTIIDQDREAIIQYSHMGVHMRILEKKKEKIEILEVEEPKAVEPLLGYKPPLRQPTEDEKVLCCCCPCCPCCVRCLSDCVIF